jgi:hypothetical protein
LNNNRWWSRTRGRHRRPPGPPRGLPPPASEEPYASDDPYASEAWRTAGEQPRGQPPALDRAAADGTARDAWRWQRPVLEERPVADLSGDTNHSPVKSVRTGVKVMNLETSLKEAMNIDGSMGIALIDYNSGMPLGTLTSVNDLDLDIIAAGTTDFVRAKMRTLELMRLDEPIEDILVTLTTQYHVIRPVTSRSGKGLFFYLMLDKKRANLALARHRLARIERDLEV